MFGWHRHIHQWTLEAITYDPNYYREGTYLLFRCPCGHFHQVHLYGKLQSMTAGVIAQAEQILRER